MAKFLISRTKVLEQYDRVSELADAVSYSSKTNPDVTRVLEKERDCFFSIHLLDELVNINDKTRIIYLAQGWEEGEVKKLLELGVKNFVVDNEVDLEILDEVMGKRRGKINLFLRMKLKENTLRTEKYYVFGFRTEILEKHLFRLREKNWVDKLGIHFHRKTQNIAEWDLVREISDSLDKRVFSILNFVIMGGGLPSIYANTNIKVFEGIYKKIKEFRSWLNSLGIKVIIEPGRFIAAPAGKLVTVVKAVYDKNIIVDASVYNSDMDALIVPVKLLVEGEVERGEGEAYVIKGITPCSMDLFRYRVYFARAPKKGERIVFLNAGAYNFSSDFCNLKKIETKIVE